jgi:hypothetical protein
MFTKKPSTITVFMSEKVSLKEGGKKIEPDKKENV